SPFAQAWLQRRARGIEMTVINIRDVRALPVPLPPRSVQQEIVTRVNVLFETAKSFSSRLAEATEAVDALEREVMQLAFAGRLVPQSPDDKPAPIFQHADITAQKPKGPAKVQRRAPRMRTVQPRVTIGE